MSDKPKFCQKRKERLKLLIHILTINTLKVIKPLCGTDSLLLQNLETYFTLQYPKVGQSSSKTSCTLKIKNCHGNTFAYKGWFIGNSRHNKHIHISTVCTAEQEIVTICIKSYVPYFVGQKSSFPSNTCGKGPLKPVPCFWSIFNLGNKRSIVLSVWIAILHTRPGGQCQLCICEGRIWNNHFHQ